MRKIFKYPLEISDKQEVILPKGAEILHANVQNESLFIWALIDPGAETIEEIRDIFIYGTGHPVSPIAKRYISTVFMGSLVFHVFE